MHRKYSYWFIGNGGGISDRNTVEIVTSWQEWSRTFSHDSTLRCWTMHFKWVWLLSQGYIRREIFQFTSTILANQHQIVLCSVIGI